MATRVDASQVSAAMKRLLDAASGDKLADALMAGGLVLEGKAKGNIIRFDYIDTGATLNSTQAREASSGGDTAEVQVGPTTDYAIYGELGIGQPAKPFMRNAFDEGKSAAVGAVVTELKKAVGG